MYDIENHRIFADQLGFWILRMAQAVRTDHGMHLLPSGVTVTEYWALKALQTERIRRPGEIAKVLGVNPAEVSRLSRQLVRKGLVTRTPDPEDLRAVRLELTNNARRLISTMDRQVGRAEGDLTERMAPEDRDKLRALLIDRLARTGGWDLEDL